jgi:hypothetical protein
MENINKIFHQVLNNYKAAVLFQYSRHDATIYVYISHLIQLNEAIRTKKDVLNSIRITLKK